MFITKTELDDFIPANGVIITPYCIPSFVDKDEIIWNNDNEDLVVSLNLNTKELTGHYYTYSEEDNQHGIIHMKDSDIAERLRRGEFLAIDLA